MSPRHDPEDVPIPKPRFKQIGLRVPRWMAATIKRVVAETNEREERYPKLSRNEWIVEAINEKLRRERD
jgi:hypothetical protein